MTEIIIATAIGGLIPLIVVALIALVWRKGVLPGVRGWWRRLQRHRRERAIRQLKKAVAKKLQLLQLEDKVLRIDSGNYDIALGEAHRDRLVAFGGFQLDTRITPSDYKIAQALKTLVAERTLHKVVEGPLWGYGGERPQYVFSYHAGSEASYDAEQKRLELEAACMQYSATTQGFSDACPNPRYVRYNASDKPNTTIPAIKKREDSPEHCARCWEMRR